METKSKKERAYREANKEKVAANRKAYREANPETHRRLYASV